MNDEPFSPKDGVPASGSIPKVFVIDGLLDLTLSISSITAFNSRLAACECIKAYFHDHSLIKRHFLRRAIDGHMSGADETANILTTLMQPIDKRIKIDPYRHWFASVLLFHLIFEDGEAKKLAMSVVEGDASTGEEVITCIQTLSENMLSGISQGVDQRVIIGYLMLLCGWLFEDPDAVNDFLGEGSNVQGIVDCVMSKSAEGVMVQGLSAILLGLVYEFSTKDSPIGRSQLHQILTSRLGRNHYLNRLSTFRACTAFRDYEVIPQKLNPGSPGGLPEIFFDQAFVVFLKDNYARILRAIDREPSMEVSVVSNGVQKGISREMVDSLRSQLEEKSEAYQASKDQIISLERQLNQEQAELRKAREITVLEVAKLQNLNNVAGAAHAEEMARVNAEFAVDREHLQRQLDHVQKSLENNNERFERLRKKGSDEVAELKARLHDLERHHEDTEKRQAEALEIANNDFVLKQTLLEKKIADESRMANEATKEVENLKQEFHNVKGTLETRLKSEQNNLATALDQMKVGQKEADKVLKLCQAQLEAEQRKVAQAEEQITNHKQAIVEAEQALAKKEAERKAAQTELEELLLVFEDLEEKSKKYKERLVALGETVSDGEDEDDDDDD